MKKPLPLVALSLTALLALTACGSKSQPEASTPTSSATSTSASASPSPTAEPSQEPTAEQATQEAAPEPSQDPSPEPSPEETEAFPGETRTESGVTFFVPQGYSRDESPSQGEIFAYQYTHYQNEERTEADGRLMVGTPYQAPSDKTIEEVEKELIERLSPAWKIKETLNTRTYYLRYDGSTQVVRSEVRFASGSHPGYIMTYQRGDQIMHSAILLENDNADLLHKIEDSIGFAQ